MTRSSGTLLLLAFASTAWASDPPHDMSSSPGITCNSCHTLHIAQGASLTNVVGNANLCKSCHDSRGPTFAWPVGYQAVPDSQGRSHRWDATAANPTFGATTPTNPGLLAHLSGTTLQCSTCHDQHLGANANRGRQRVSVTVGAAITRTAGSGTGTLVLNQPNAAATAKGYRVEVLLGGAAGAATFRVSNDNGLSWFGWNAGAWAAGTPTGAPTGAAVPLNDGVNVTVTFAGTFVTGDAWNFYVSYPFLQMPMTDSALCENCHLQRVQTAASVESGGDGVKVFSHPVGESLAKAYDRAPTALLDSNGAPQTTGDGLLTNDLTLDSTNKVRCLTCHGLHNVDSNSLTEDLR